MPSVMLQKEDLTPHAIRLGIWDSLTGHLPPGSTEVEVAPYSPGRKPQSWYSARAALRDIKCYPVNGNSDPDRMASAIEHIYQIASHALARMEE